MSLADHSEGEESFAARIETERLGPESFRAVLVMITSQGGEDGMLRIPLAGEHPTALEARFAAKLAIEAMGRLPDAR